MVVVFATDGGEEGSGSARSLRLASQAYTGRLIGLRVESTALNVSML
jgi:hypothetical protein